MVDLEPDKGGALFALRLSDGRRIWQSPTPAACADREHCSPALLAAVTAIPGVVFSGSLDGHLRAHSSETGKNPIGFQHGPRLRNRQRRCRPRWFSKWAACGCCRWKFSTSTPDTSGLEKHPATSFLPSLRRNSEADASSAEGNASAARQEFFTSETYYTPQSSPRSSPSETTPSAALTTRA